MTNDRQPIFQEVKEVSYGIAEMHDLVNLFTTSAKIPSETVGSVSAMNVDEIRKEWKHYGKFMQNMRVISKYIKAHGMTHGIDSYRIRSPMIKSARQLIKMFSSLQFFKAFDSMMELYLEEEADANWGYLSIQPKYEDGVLVDTKVFIGDTEIDMSKATPIQAMTWDGRLIGTYDMINIVPQIGKIRHDSEECYPVFPALRPNDASLGDANIHEEAERRHGILNKGDIRKSMVTGVLDFPLFRILPENEDDQIVDTYETPVLTELDYCHDIDMGDHIRMLTIYDKLVEEEKYDNTREFALLNLFRWGILSKEKYDRGSAIVNAVLNAPRIQGEDYQTTIDHKLVAWGSACVSDAMKRHPNMSEREIDNIIMSGSTISKIASMMSQAYLILHVLIVTDIEERDLGFREARITLRSKKENTTRFNSMARITPDDYKIVELDKEDRMIGTIDVMDIFAIQNHDVTCVVVKLDGETKADKEQLDFYHKISTFVDPKNVKA